MERDVVESATLIIYGGDFEPSDITKSLGLHPTQVWKKGERKAFTRIDGTRLVFDSIHQSSGWKMWLEEPQNDRPLADQLEHWRNLLAPVSAELRAVSDQGLTVELNCFVTTDTITTLRISPALQAAFAAMGIHLDITLTATAIVGPYPRLH
jgi:hypothetical protein